MWKIGDQIDGREFKIKSEERLRGRIATYGKRLVTLRDRPTAIDRLLRDAFARLRFETALLGAFDTDIMFDSGSTAVDAQNKYSRSFPERACVQLAAAIGPYPPGSPLPVGDYPPDDGNCLTTVRASLTGPLALPEQPSPALIEVAARVSIRPLNNEGLQPIASYIPLLPGVDTPEVVGARLSVSLRLSSPLNPIGVSSTTIFHDVAQAPGGTYSAGVNRGSAMNVRVLALVDPRTTNLSVSAYVDAWVLSAPSIDQERPYNRGHAQLEFMDKTGVIGERLVRFGEYAPSAEIAVEDVKALVLSDTL